MDSRNSLTGGKNRRHLSPCCRFLCADLVMSFAYSTVKSSSSFGRGARISIALTMVRITPWKLQRTILLCTRILSRTSSPCCADLVSSGVAFFFFLQFVMLTVQLFWVCELTYTGWKQIPGAICRVPQVVPISLVVSELPPSLVLLSVFSSA
jgi:hypothetical protein